jgi:hypothetical protein
MLDLQPSQSKKDLGEVKAMEQIDMLPQQSLQTIANWGTTFLAKASQEKELIQLYGKPLYNGAIAFSKWWRSLSIGQIQAINQIDFPYWTLDAARKLAKVPLTRLDNALKALQKVQLSVRKLSRILNKSLAPKKLSFGRAITSEDWDLIARSLNLDAIAIDAIRQKAELLNGRQSSQQQVTTDDVIEILRELGYPIEQLLPKPRVKRYSPLELAREVQEALQTRALELQEAQERIRSLELENIALRNHSQFTEAREPAVEVTPIESVNPQIAQFVVESNLVESQETSSDEGDVFDLTLWETFQVGESLQTVDITPVVESPGTTPDVDSDFEPIVKAMPLKIHSLVRVVDKGVYRDYYGCTGIVKGRSTNAWWVRLDNGDYKQFPASALEQIPQSQESSEMFPLSERVVPKFSEVGRSLFQPNLHPVAG